MNVQADVGHIVNMLGGDHPDDFTDLPLGKMWSVRRPVRCAPRVAF
jgi:hypothetical protein